MWEKQLEFQPKCLMFQVSSELHLLVNYRLYFQSKFNFYKLYKCQKKRGVEVIYLLTLHMGKISEYNEVDENFSYTHLSLSDCQGATCSNALIRHAITFTKTVSQCWAVHPLFPCSTILRCAEKQQLNRLVWLRIPVKKGWEQGRKFPRKWGRLLITVNSWI